MRGRAVIAFELEKFKLSPRRALIFKRLLAGNCFELLKHQLQVLTRGRSVMMISITCDSAQQASAGRPVH
jgi:hypothetical protein